MSSFALGLLFAVLSAAEDWTKLTDTSSNEPYGFWDIRGHTAVMDSGDKMWVFAGSKEEAYGYCQSWLVYFDTKTSQWSSDITVSNWSPNTPSPRRDHTAVMDSNAKMWIFGGQTCAYDAEFNKEVYYFDTRSLTWTQPTITGTPGDRSKHCAVMDSKGRMWVFGGAAVNNGPSITEVWYLDTVALEWINAKPDTWGPNYMQDATAVIDSNDGI